MGHLTTLVGLRLRLGVREASGRRGLLVGVLAAAPGLAIGSLVMAAFVFLGVRALGRAEPSALAPVLSALATAAGLMAVVAPLAGSISPTDIPDIVRLRHFPVRPVTLVTAHLVASITHPLVLLQGLLPLAAAAGVAGSGLGFVAAAMGFVTSWATIVAATQLVQLALTLWARQPRLRDRLLLLGAPVGMALGLLPFLVLGLGPHRLFALHGLVVEHDVFAWSPLAWGARAAVFGAQGNALAWSLQMALALLAFMGILGSMAALVAHLGRTEVSQGRSRSGGKGLRAKSVVGTLVEKDLRLAWRDPALRMSLAAGLIGPLLVLLLLSGGGAAVGPVAAIFLGGFLGLTSSGMNVFALERRAVTLLLAFPVPRWKILVAKSVVQLLLRSPVVIGLLAAIALMGSARTAWAAALTALCVWLVGSGADGVVSVLHPLAFAPPGGSPTAHQAGVSGLASAGWAMARVAFVVVASAPFVFLVALPGLLEMPWLMLGALPLAMAGALAVHVMLVGAAERLLLSREASVLARAVGST